jgi:hypothetical protein
MELNVYSFGFLYKDECYVNVLTEVWINDFVLAFLLTIENFLHDDLKIDAINHQ